MIHQTSKEDKTTYFHNVLEAIPITVASLESGERTDSRFVHLTYLAVSLDTVALLSTTGRLRWKIENEGFNTQKNLGYGLQRKCARVDRQAAKNYYHCLQIGHLINQSMVLSTAFEPLLQGKTTLRHLWHTMIAFLLYEHMCHRDLGRLEPTPSLKYRAQEALAGACG